MISRTSREATRYILCPLKFGRTNETNTCEGAECGAWRWYNTERKVKDQEIGRGHYSPAEYVDLPKDQWTGYCGLGGKP